MRHIRKKTLSRLLRGVLSCLLAALLLCGQVACTHSDAPAASGSSSVIARSISLHTRKKRTVRVRAWVWVE